MFIALGIFVVIFGVAFGVHIDLPPRLGPRPT